MSDNVSKSSKRRATSAQPGFDGTRIATRLILAALALGAFVIWFSPYWAVAGLGQDAKAGNVQAVSKHLDLPRLRESMKMQLVTASQVRLSKHKSAPLQIAGAVASALASDKIVDTAVTPEVITKLIATELQDFHGSRLSGAIALALSSRAGWLSDSTFQVRVGSNSVLYWTRDGLDWRLDALNVR